MMRLDGRRTFEALGGRVDRLFELSGPKILALAAAWDDVDGAPVVTVEGRYRPRHWTRWTEGFPYGSALIQFDATNDRRFLEIGRGRTLERMAPHLTHSGVHDHGFTIVSTYGALWRLAREERLHADAWERRHYELALRVSGAVQARRWTRLTDNGFINSFNGPHSLFIDTMRTLRSLAIAWQLRQMLLEEQDAEIDLLGRLVQHARTTARFNVYYGERRDRYDVRGRVAHESLFNPVSGTYRGPSTQQGYSPFTTWTRGLAWAVLGFAEQIEFLAAAPDEALARCGGRADVDAVLLDAARATADYYIEQAAADGVPYWDTGAPGLDALGDWGARAADPFNDREPVDSSAAAIAAQGLLRLARILSARDGDAAARYEQAGLLIVESLFDENGPYMSRDPDHQGLLLHSVYHWPNGWDYVPPGSRIPRGESSQWGDYHARELALYVKRAAERLPYLAFFANQ